MANDNEYLKGYKTVYSVKFKSSFFIRDHRSRHIIIHDINGSRKSKKHITGSYRRREESENAGGGGSREREAK